MTNYLIGLGSNIEPLMNVPRMVRGLLSVADRVILSRIISTEPVGMDSDHNFLNGVALLETSLSQANLKHYLNRLEGKLGRDRTNPDKKTSDRQADFDILAQVDTAIRYSHKTLPRDGYCQDVLEELLYMLGMWREPENRISEGVSLKFGHMVIGLAPMQVYPSASANLATSQPKRTAGWTSNSKFHLHTTS